MSNLSKHLQGCRYNDTGRSEDCVCGYLGNTTLTSNVRTLTEYVPSVRDIPGVKRSPVLAERNLSGKWIPPLAVYVARDVDREIERLRSAMIRAYGIWSQFQGDTCMASNGMADVLNDALSGDGSQVETSAFIPARPYPGDEVAVREAGITLPYCTCYKASDDPHKSGCPFWEAILTARKSWHDRNVVAWSCSQEAKGQQRCEQWCGYPEFCTATGTDRRKTSAQETKPKPTIDGLDRLLQAEDPTPVHVWPDGTVHDAPSPPEKAPTDEVLREGKCANCGKSWVVKGDPAAVVSVLAVHCTCGHINK